LFLYSAYGLNIHSAVPLPELLPGTSPWDVSIRLEHFERPPTPEGQQGSCLKATPGEACLRWERVGTFWVRSGCEILIDPAPDVGEEVLRLFILGPGLAVLLHQRQYLILHASAVALGDVAALFLGGSGWGKSTMAAVLQARGHDMLADDIVPVAVQTAGKPFIWGGFPQLKIWPEVSDALEGIPDELPRLHPEMEKRGLRIPQKFRQGSIPVGRVYILQEGDRPVPQVLPIRPQEALVELVRHSFLARLLERTGDQARHFQQASRVVEQVPVRRLIRRKDLARLDEMACLIEQDAQR